MGPSDFVNSVPRRIRLGFLIVAGVLLTGTLWFWIVEDFDLLDAAYQTVTTVSTVGFEEIRPFDTSAKVFAIFLIVIGVGAVLYVATAVFEEIVEEQIGRFGRRRMERRINRLSGHTVVCGYGRVGRTVASLMAGSNAVVVIESEIEKVQAAIEQGLLALAGDATEDAVIEQAGLDRAAILVSALPTDADNLYVTLSGRTVNPKLHIVARARAEGSEPKLLRAGADRVINPQDIGAHRMAAFALQPTVSDFLDVVMHGAGPVAYRLEEVSVPEGSPLEGCSIRETHIRDHTGALVLALRGGDGGFTTNPPPEQVLGAGVTMIVIGTGDQLERLHTYIRQGRIDQAVPASAPVDPAPGNR